MMLVDLTHTFTSDMPVYPGDPKATLEQVAFIDKDTYNDHKLSTLMHVGTHMDAPLHMIDNGKTMDEIPPENFFGQGILIDVRGKKEIDSSVLGGVTIRKDSLVLLYTGFGEKYRTDEYFKEYPEVKEDFAKQMVASQVRMVGMDMLGPDYDSPWVAHKILLGHDILIVENLTNLDQLLTVKNFDVIALPAKLKADAAPVRVVALIKE
jgi:kynurenine formamidase